MVSERCAFGERLKRHRERRGVTLESIARTTKISAALFVGLEKGDCSRWPAGLYARAYIRSYAEALGLNANETVEEFAATFGETPTTHSEALVAATRVPSASHLRLSMAAEPAIHPELLARRAALAAADLVIGFLIAALAYVGFGASVWITVGCALAYHTGGRLVSDQPLLYWLYRRIRTQPAPVAPEGASPDAAPVADPASTVA